MAKVFSVTVCSHMMIAHSLPHPDFGPAQALHGATYVVEATFERAELSDSGIVIDIGLATTALQEITGELTYRNLDEHPRFAGTLTTTGGPLLIGLAGNWKSSGTSIDVCLDVTINGARIGHASYGVSFMQSVAANLYLPVAWSAVRAMAAGTYALKLQWRTSSGTLWLGPNGTTQFYAVELV